MVNPAPIELSSIGMADSLILMLLALVVFGPRKLPELGRQLGKIMFEFRKASNDFKFQINEELRNAEDAERRAKEEAERQRAQAAAAVQPALAASSESVSNGPYTDSVPAGPIPDQQGEPSLPRLSGPVIQPPSSGETVAAARPTAVEPPQEPASADAATQTPAESSSAQSSSTETLIQHG